MYQALYRKWRPKTFEDVSGQPQVTKTLKNELKSGRLSHAYLFTGSRGTGKTSSAKILAKAINCLNPIDGDPCCECEICKGIDNGTVLDIVEIDAASNNGVENIRLLREEASFTPSSAKFRVYIIDEVHMLSTGAFNALLKTLEEPPKHVVFILATTEVHKIPATILSRCQRFDFHRISSEDMVERLSFISEQEGKQIDEDAALMVARLSDGALRDALSLLDQCFSKSDHVTYSVVEETAGLAGDESVFFISDCIINQNSADILNKIAFLYDSSKDMEKLLSELLNHFRNLMLFKTMKDPSDIVVLSKEKYEMSYNQAQRLSIEEIIYIIDALQSSLSRMSMGSNKRIEIEMCLVKLCSKELDDSNLSLLNRISKLERIIRSGNIAAVSTQKENVDTQVSNEKINKEPRPHVGSTDKDAKPVETVEGKDKVDNKDLVKDAVKMSDWPEVLNILKTYSRSIAAAFSGSTAYISGGFVLIDAPNDMAFELLRKSAGRDKMRVAIKEVTGRTYRLGPYKSSVNKKDAGEDPLNELIKRAEDSGISLTKI